MQFWCIFYVLHKNIMNVTGRPTPEILNKFLFTHVVKCYNDICRYMASSNLFSSRLTSSQTLNGRIQTVLFLYKQIYIKTVCISIAITKYLILTCFVVFILDQSHVIQQ